MYIICVGEQEFIELWEAFTLNELLIEEYRALKHVARIMNDFELAAEYRDKEKSAEIIIESILDLNFEEYLRNKRLNENFLEPIHII